MLRQQTLGWATTALSRELTLAQPEVNGCSEPMMSIFHVMSGAIAGPRVGDRKPAAGVLYGSQIRPRVQLFARLSYRRPVGAGRRLPGAFGLIPGGSALCSTGGEVPHLGR
jgi:hypothetical protein